MSTIWVQIDCNPYLLSAVLAAAKDAGAVWVNGTPIQVDRPVGACLSDGGGVGLHGAVKAPKYIACSDQGTLTHSETLGMGTKVTILQWMEHMRNVKTKVNTSITIVAHDPVCTRKYTVKCKNDTLHIGCWKLEKSEVDKLLYFWHDRGKPWVF